MGTGSGSPREIDLSTAPADVHAEQCVLSALLTDPTKLAEVEPLIGPEHFHLVAHSTLYGTIRRVAADCNGAFDVAMLQSHLKDSDQWDTIGGATYLAEIIRAAPVAAHAKYHAEIIRDKAILRKLKLDTLDLLRDVHAPDAKGWELAARAQSLFENNATEATKSVFRTWTVKQLMEEEFHVVYLVDRLFAELLPLVIGGPAKAMKTSILIALAYALVTATRFLGHFRVERAVRVGVMTAESGMPTIRGLLRRIGEVGGIAPGDLGDALVICDDVPRVDNPEHEAGVRRLILDYGLEVLAFDPFYLQSDEDSQSNLARQGRQLRKLSKLCTDMGVTPIFCHHTKKSTLQIYEPLGLGDLHGAGLAEFARQFWLVNRRAPYRHDGRHELHFAAGASLGHGGHWWLDVNEGVWDGPGTRFWDVVVLEPEEGRQKARDEAEDVKETAKAVSTEEAAREIVETMRLVAPETQTEIRKVSRVGGDRFVPAWNLLVANKAVRETTIKKGNNREYPAWELTEKATLF